MTGTGTRTINFRGNVAETNVPQMTGDASGLTSATTATLTIAMATINNGQGINIPADGGLFNGPHVDARRTGQNTGDLRAKLLRITVKAGDITPAEENSFRGAYTVPAGNLFPVGTARTRPEIYAMGFRNPFRLTLDKNDVAYISDYSPDSQVPVKFRGPAGTGRFQVVDEARQLRLAALLPARPAVLQVGLQHVDPAPERGGARGPRVRQPDPRPAEHVPLGRERRSRGRAGPRVRASDQAVGDLVLVPRQPGRRTVRSGRRASPTRTGPEHRATPVAGMCPQLFPELFTGGVGPHGTAPYDYDPSNPSPTKFPPYYDGSFIIGEFTQDTMREVKLDSQGRVFKINQALNCGPAPPLADAAVPVRQPDGHGVRS